MKSVPVHSEFQELAESPARPLAPLGEVQAR